MPSKATLNVSLKPKLTALIVAKISTGQDPSASEVVWATLRLRDEQDRRKDRSQKSAESGYDVR